MGKIIRKCIEYGGSSNSAENIKYDDNKNVKEAIDEVKSELATTNSNLESCFQSVSNGKALLASAITDQGIKTDATATFEVMANNIRSIERTKKIDFNVWTSNYDITPIFKAPKSGYYTIHVKTSASGNMRIYKKEGETALFSMDIGANQEKIATVYLDSGNTAAVWIKPSTGAYFSGYAIIPD